MRTNIYNNGQDILNWYKTPALVKYTDAGYPILGKRETDNVDIRLLSFNKALSNNTDDYDYYVHFYIQDYMFTRIWNKPERYVEFLKKYKGVIMPDFSLFVDMPLPLQQFNYYRNLWFARMCQWNNIDVIPSICFSDDKSYDFCFQGMSENNDVFMLNTAGSLREKQVAKIFYQGVQEAIRRLKPKLLLVRATENCYNDICRYVFMPMGIKTKLIDYRFEQ